MICRDRTALISVLAILASLSLPGTGLGGETPATRERPGGRLSGTVIVGTQLSSGRMRFSLYPDLATAAAAPREREAQSELTNVVVYLEAVEGWTGSGERQVAKRMVRQKDQTFVPHVLPVLKGSTVEFPNDDAIYHNVFSLSKAASFDLGRYPQGSSKSVSFETSGIVKVFCHIHSDMSASIMVLDNPFFTIPDERGRFLIGDIPPGVYTAVAWHERARPQRRTVRIEAGREALVEFKIPLTEPVDGG